MKLNSMCLFLLIGHTPCAYAWNRFFSAFKESVIDFVCKESQLPSIELLGVGVTMFAIASAAAVLGYQLLSSDAHLHRYKVFMLKRLAFREVTFSVAAAFLISTLLMSTHTQLVAGQYFVAKTIVVALLVVVCWYLLHLTRVFSTFVNGQALIHFFDKEVRVLERMQEQWDSDIDRLERHRLIVEVANRTADRRIRTPIRSPQSYWLVGVRSWVIMAIRYLSFNVIRVYVGRGDFSDLVTSDISVLYLNVRSVFLANVIERTVLVKESKHISTVHDNIAASWRMEVIRASKAGDINRVEELWQWCVQRGLL